MSTQTSSNKQAVRAVFHKTKSITDRDLEMIRRIFWQKLKDDDLTQQEWLEKNGVGKHNASFLSRVLHGSGTSRPLLRKICKYILNQ